MGKIIHGERYTRLYKTWSSMKDRCYNEHNPSYQDYGSRGIVVCDEWCEILGLHYDNTWRRIYIQHRPIERAFRLEMKNP